MSDQKIRAKNLNFFLCEIVRRVRASAWKLEKWKRKKWKRKKCWWKNRTLSVTWLRCPMYCTCVSPRILLLFTLYFCFKKWLKLWFFLVFFIEKFDKLKTLEIFPHVISSRQFSKNFISRKKLKSWDSKCAKISWLFQLNTNQKYFKLCH